MGGPKEWVHGTVVAHHYREPSWEAGEVVPYQILLNDDDITGQQNAIWAPADVDEIIRTDFRFALGEQAECRIAEDDWARCTGAPPHGSNECGVLPMSTCLWMLFALVRSHGVSLP